MKDSVQVLDFHGFAFSLGNLPEAGVLTFAADEIVAVTVASRKTMKGLK